MSYQLEQDETIATAIKRIATEQIDKALYSLTESDDDLGERIHDTRKRFKKIRALLRLVRDDIGKDTYKYENVIYRDAGRELADLRESAVAIETLDMLLDHYEDEIEAGAYDGLRHELVQRHTALQQRYTYKESEYGGPLYRVSFTLQHARERITDWPITGEGVEAFHDGLRRVYKRGYKAMATAYNEPTAENFHEWRKRVKYLWYHTRILEMLWPDLMDELADAIHDLANLLGDAHDLADFHDLLTGNPDLSVDEEHQQALLALADRWREDLRAQAYPLGQRIYAEAPDAFMARISAYWQARPVT